MSSSTRPSSSSSSGYDERFVVPLEASRRGAHRARVSPVMTALPVVAVVGIVIGAIALVYLVLGGSGDPGADAATTVGPSSTSTSAPAHATASPSTAPTTGAAAPGAVDKAITLDVFNGTTPTVSGLARKAAVKLTSAGWTTGKVVTWDGSPVSQTTVYYATTDQKPTAQAVVKTLGRGTVKLSPARAGTGMAVVIGNDYPGANARGASQTGRSSRSAGSSATATNDPGTTAEPTASSTRSTGAGATATAPDTGRPTDPGPGAPTGGN